MPLSAIDTGFVDYVLPTEAIAPKLEEIARSGQSQKGRSQSAGES
jgi:chemotaxis response regulator CheB